MIDSANRRQYERHPLAEPIVGYLDGQRFDVSSANVSQGGLFLRVAEPERILKGTRLALVFRRESALRDRIFLVARVVRHQADPAGVGLQWVRAVTGGTADALARFLQTLLQLPAADVLARIEPEAGTGRIVYHFVEPREIVATVLPAEVTARGVIETMPHLEPPPPPPDAEVPEAAGPITQQITVDAVRAPTRLPGVLRTPSKTVSGTVVALGARGLVMQVDALLTGPFDRLEVGVKLPVEGVQVAVAGLARLTAIEPLPAGAVALDLAFEALDEGARPGVLRSYVRWLHHRSVTAA